MILKFRLLIVDDSEAKRIRTVEKLEHALPSFEMTFDIATCYEEARERLNSGSYDFLILDVKLPAGDGEPEARWSRTLLRDILGGRLGAPVHVFGLTEYEELEAGERSFYDANMFGFVKFDWEKDDWATFIANKISFVATAMNAAEAFRLNHFERDLLVLTARHDNEFIPIKKALFGEQASAVHPLWKEASHFGYITTPGRSFSTALVCVGEMGLAATAAITAQAIRVLRPRMVVMLGMCAGFKGKGAKILDSIIATEAACWQDGKYEHADKASKFDKRAKNRNCSLQVRGIIEHFVERYDESFAALAATISLEREFLDIKSAFGDAVRETPAVKNGLLLSGSSIVADDETRTKIEADFGTALGLEMEVYGMYTAAFKSMGKQPEYFAIKTIADFADGEKKDRAQALASTISARVLMRMLELGHAPDKFAMIDASPRLLEE